MRLILIGTGRPLFYRPLNGRVSRLPTHKYFTGFLIAIHGGGLAAGAIANAIAQPAFCSDKAKPDGLVPSIAALVYGLAVR